jgi:hypothetical protein
MPSFPPDWANNTTLFSSITKTINVAQRGRLKEPIPAHIPARKRQRKLPYAIGKPRDYELSQMGDPVQLDTLDIRLLIVYSDVLSWHILVGCGTLTP